MPRQRNMAILASIVDPATPHLDRYNIRRRLVVRTPRLRIDLDPAHLWPLPSAWFSHHVILSRSDRFSAPQPM